MFSLRAGVNPNYFTLVVVSLVNVALVTPGRAIMSSSAKVLCTYFTVLKTGLGLGGYTEEVEPESTPALKFTACNT